jgi:hypothetical protein
MVEDQRRQKVELQRRFEHRVEDDVLEEIAFQAASHSAIDALVKKADAAYTAMGGMDGARGRDRTYETRLALRAAPLHLAVMEADHQAGTPGQPMIAAMALPTEWNHRHRVKGYSAEMV